jgi:nucleoid DNA-binding protein
VRALVDNRFPREFTTRKLFWSARKGSAFPDFQKWQECTMATKSGAKPMSKSEVLNTLAQESGLSRKQVASVLDGLSGLISRNVGKKGPGVFAVPGLMKITVQHKPATKPRKGINPFTGQEMMFKAKPARNVVRIRPLKSLKDMVK